MFTNGFFSLSAEVLQRSSNRPATKNCILSSRNCDNFWRQEVAAAPSKLVVQVHRRRHREADFDLSLLYVFMDSER